MNAGQGDRVLPAFQSLPPFAREQQALARIDGGRQRQAVARVERDVIGYLDRVTELLAALDTRHQDAGLVLDRRVGLRHHRHPGERYAQELKRGVLEDDRLVLLLVQNAIRLDLPDRLFALHAVAVDAGKIGTVLEDRQIAVASRGLARRKGDSIGRDEFEAFHDAVGKIVIEVDLGAVNDIPVGIGDLDVARSCHTFGLAVDDHLVSHHHVIEIVDDDASGRRDRIGVHIVGDRVRLDHHLVFAARLLGRANHAGQRGILDELGKGASRQKDENRRSYATQKAGGVSRLRCLRYDRSTHAHPSSRNSRTVEPNRIATTEGAHAARTGDTSPSLPSERATSMTT